MGYKQFLASAKANGVLLNQSLLYKYVSIGFTQEEADKFFNEDVLPEGLDPQKVKDLALQWTEDQVFQRIPQQHNLAYC
jgi:hypothetical protein